MKTPIFRGSTENIRSSIQTGEITAPAYIWDNSLQVYYFLNTDNQLQECGIPKLVGTNDERVVLNGLDDGIYEVKGVYVITPNDATTNSTDTYIPVIIRTIGNNRNIKCVDAYEIIDYVVNGNTVTKDAYAMETYVDESISDAIGTIPPGSATVIDYIDSVEYDITQTINNLATYVGEIPSSSTATSVTEYVGDEVGELWHEVDTINGYYIKGSVNTEGYLVVANRDIRENIVEDSGTKLSDIIDELSDLDDNKIDKIEEPGDNHYIMQSDMQGGIEESQIPITDIVTAVEPWEYEGYLVATGYSDQGHPDIRTTGIAQDDVVDVIDWYSQTGRGLDNRINLINIDLGGIHTELGYKAQFYNKNPEGYVIIGDHDSFLVADSDTKIDTLKNKMRCYIDPNNSKKLVFTTN